MLGPIEVEGQYKYVWRDCPNYVIVSTSPLDIRMTLSLPMAIYREWAVVFVSRGGGAHKHKFWAVNRYIHIDK